MFSRVITGARNILIIAPLAVILSTVLGTALGLVMGYFRGLVDESIARVLEAFLALPLVVIALTASPRSAPSNLVIILVIALVFTPLIARTVRTSVLLERELDYVAAARLRGEKAPYIMFVEILPNVMSPIVVEFTVRIGYAVFAIATLSFLGFGVQPPSPDWAAGHLDQLRAGERRLLVGGAVRRHRARLAGDRRQPDRRCRRGGDRSMSTDAAEAAPATSAVSTDALTVEHVDVAYTVRRRDQAVLRDVSFRIGRGESFGLVGESGCGKSTMALAIVRYLARNGRVSAGSIAIDGQDVLAMNEAALRRLRANTVSMVYQEPGRALNPSIRVGQQVAEVFQIAGKSDKEALELSEEMLRKVRISDPAGVMQPLSAPAVGRHAPARGDRDGAGLRAVAADPRRADHRARRHRRGRGARSRQGAARRSSAPRCCSSATTSA